MLSKTLVSNINHLLHPPYISAAHFTAGQYVDVQGQTVGKGYAGPMKRWGFKGLPATHGTTKKHRAHGSIGNCQDPGRVFPGKKMGGRMGNRKRTVQNVWVFKVDAERNLIYVKGQIPGKAGNFLRIKDALRKPPMDAPFPTFDGDATKLGVTVADPGPDPFVTGE